MVDSCGAFLSTASVCDAAFISYEHWIGYQTTKGLGIRARRFLPAHGVRFADHDVYTRLASISSATIKSMASKSATRSEMACRRGFQASGFAPPILDTR